MYRYDKRLKQFEIEGEWYFVTLTDEWETLTIRGPFLKKISYDIPKVLRESNWHHDCLHFESFLKWFGEFDKATQMPEFFRTAFKEKRLLTFMEDVSLYQEGDDFGGYEAIYAYATHHQAAISSEELYRQKNLLILCQTGVLGDYYEASSLSTVMDWTYRHLKQEGLDVDAFLPTHLKMCVETSIPSLVLSLFNEHRDGPINHQAGPLTLTGLLPAEKGGFVLYEDPDCFQSHQFPDWSMDLLEFLLAGFPVPLAISLTHVKEIERLA